MCWSWWSNLSMRLFDRSMVTAIGCIGRNGRRRNDVQRPGRKCESDAAFAQLAHQLDVDALLLVHVDAVSRVQHDVDDFIVERAVAEAFEMRAVETQSIAALHDPLHETRD